MQLFREIAVVACLATPPGTVVLAAPFPCPAVKADPQRQPSYAPSADRTRCEGFVSQDVAAPYLEVVSLVRMGSQLPTADKPFEFRTQAIAAKVVVLPLVQGVAYRVDMALPAAGARWTPSQMLKATGLALDNLGFLAPLPTSSPDLLALTPVSVGDGTAGTGAIGIVRTSTATREMRWRMTPDPRDHMSGKWTLVPNGAVGKWGLVPIQLPLPPALASSSAVIEVEGHQVDGSLMPILQFSVGFQ